MKTNPTSKQHQLTRRAFCKAGAVSMGGLAGLGALPLQGHAATDKVPAIGSVIMDPLVPLAAVPGDYLPAFADSSQTGHAWVEVRWNQAKNKVDWFVHYDHLPYRPTVERPIGTNPHSQSLLFTPDYPEMGS